MGISFWKSVRDSVREFFDLIWAMDQRSLVVVEEGFELLWQDIRSFFAD